MNKTTLAAIAAIVVASTAICGIINHAKTPNSNLNALTLINIEALSQDKEATKCPDFNYVPDHFLSAKVESFTVSSSEEGELTILGISFGSYEKNKEYTAIIETKDCDQKQDGACCDQREVGSTVLNIVD